MDEKLKNVSGHMYEFAMALLGHSLWHAIMSGPGNSGVFSLMHAAHGGELIVKAAIAKQHPLLILSKLPGIAQQEGKILEFEDIVKAGKTLNYSELPNVLWAATGYKIKSIDIYREVGEIRNSAQHFSAPVIDYQKLVLSYLCLVVDPILIEFWGTEVFKEIVKYWDEEESVLFQEEAWVKNAIDECGIKYSGWIPTNENWGEI